MKIKNNWLILKGKFKCEGFYYGNGKSMSKNKVIEFQGVEGEVFGSDWVEVSKGVYECNCHGFKRIVRVD